MDEDVLAIHPADGSLDTANLISPINADPDEQLTSEIKIKKPNRLIVVEPLLMLMFISSFPIYLLLSLYVYDRFQGDVARDMNVPQDNITDAHCQEINKSSTFYIAQQRTQALNSRFNIYFSFSYSIPCLITTSFLSGYSDKAGRKYAIVVPTVGLLLGVVVYLIVILMKLPLWCLLIGGFFTGAGGNYQMLLAGCFAYLGDTVEPNKRMFRIAVVELLGFMVGSAGPLAVGYLIPVIGYAYLMIIFMVGYVLSVLYAIFFIPETIIQEGRVSLLSFRHLKSFINLFAKDTEEGGRRWKLNILLVTFFFVALVNLGDVGIFTLYELNSPLCWTSSHIGNFNAIYISCGTAVGISLAKILKIFLIDAQICFIAGLSGVGHFTYLVFVQTSLMMYFSPVLGVAERLMIPSLRAIMSTLATPTEQGAVFGSIALLEVVCDLAGSVTFNAIYERTLAISSGFVFSVMAGCYLVGTILIGVYNIKTRSERRIR